MNHSTSLELEENLHTSRFNPQEYLLLICILLAVFVVPTSISGTAIALPYISADLQTNATFLQWSVNAFNLTFASFTLAWGKLADKFGAKPCFVIGSTLYLIASILSFLSTHIYLLDISRALAGIGGAAIFSCGSAILIQNFSGKKRTTAFAFFGTTAGLGITFGPMISSALINLAHWQTIFLFHTLTILIVLTLSYFLPQNSHPRRNHKHKESIHAKAIILFISALFCLMLAITQSAEIGWFSFDTIILFSLSALFLLILLTLEKHTKDSLLDLSLLRNRYFLGMLFIPVIASFAFVTLLSYFPTYLVIAYQLSVFSAGLTMLSLTLPVLIFPILAGYFVTKGLSAKSILYTSLGCFLAGLLLLLGFHSKLLPINLISDDLLKPSFMYLIAISLSLIGIGMGLSAGLVDGIALGQVKAEHVGSAAGLLNTFRLGSEAIAVAIYASLITSRSQHQLSEHSLSQFNDSVLTGNITQFVGTELMPTISNIYSISFAYTIGILLIICLLLSTVVFYLLRTWKM